jgi:hypothetical protein
MLGAPQLKWFEDELIAAQKRNAVWKLVVLSSPIQELGRTSQIGSDQNGTKSWAGGYVCERNKILKFIDDNAINNVVFISTDNHYTVINNLSYNSDPADPKSLLKPARNSFEIVTGPIGASTGIPTGLKTDVQIPSRDADKKIVDIWNGDAAGTDGKVLGLKQAGLDPIGLEKDFPGLDAASIKADGVADGTVTPLGFVSFGTFTYAVLTFDATSLHVQVKGLPYIADPATLLKADAEKEYESRTAKDILSFTVKAQ